MNDTPQSKIPLIASVAVLARGYGAWLCDIWGVMHNGIEAYPAAVDACLRYRAGGGVVILLSNAPRPSQSVIASLDRIGLPRDAFDGVVTSGDVARAMLGREPGARVFHLGPPRDLPVFEGLDVAIVEPEEAAWLVCTGLDDDDTETPSDYAGILEECRRLGLPMICANPDLMVERGDRLVFCAGALAAEYEKLGGKVIYTGKPHLPIYERAFAMIDEIRGASVPLKRILAIGDGLKTDIAGAANAGVDALFVASKLHVNGSSGLAAAAPQEIAGLFTGGGRPPVAAQLRLAW